MEKIFAKHVLGNKFIRNIWRTIQTKWQQKNSLNWGKHLNKYLLVNIYTNGQ